MFRNVCLSLLVLAMVLAVAPAGAILHCDDCSCTHSCSLSCVTDFGWSTCGAQGACSGAPGCGGGCLTIGPGGKLIEKLDGGASRALSPADGQAVARLTWRLAQHAEEGGLGSVYAGQAGPATRSELGAPALAFVSRDRLELASAIDDLRVAAPELVVEAVALVDGAGAARARGLRWLGAGADVALVLDASTRTVTVMSGKVERVLGAGDELRLPKLLPGFAVKVGDLFE